MVFHFRCFSFPFEENEEEEMQYDTKTQTKSTSTAYYTASSHQNQNGPIYNEMPGFTNSANNLIVFTIAELKAATNNFSRSGKLGEGGFGCVYRGTINNPQKTLDVAVKALNKRGLQGHKEWLTEVNFLGVVDHPNLVKLVGYCAEDDERGIQRLLVYEYMPNTSVAHHLYSSSEAPLSWAMRLKVAQDTARGLTYLHERMNFQIIFRDFKSSNVLLDENWNAKLSDFGLARLGPQDGFTHVSTAVVGTMGYGAPEYIQTGKLTSKNDVWAYGVFLYELITGRRPLDNSRPQNEKKLLEWVKLRLESKNFKLIMDTRLEGEYSLKSAYKLSSIANRCLSRNAESRPKMSEVLEMVDQLIEVSSEATSPENKTPNNTKSKGSPDIQHTKSARFCGCLPKL